MDAVNLARRSRVEISIAGKNVTTDLAPYLSSFSFNDKTGTEVDDLTITLDDRDELFTNEWMPERGDKVEATIWADDWSSPDTQDELFCGQFEIDLVTESGDANKVEIKAVSSLNSNIRHEIHTKKWESASFMAVCESIAKSNGYQLNFSGEDVDFDVCDQTEQSDLAFLTKIADDNDFLIKFDGDIMVVCSREELETQPPQFEISKYDILNRQAGVQGFGLYKEAKASYYDPNKKRKNSASVTHKQAKYQLKNNTEWQAANSKPKSKKPASKPFTTQSYFDKTSTGGKILRIRQKFHSAAEAERVALAKLRQKNKGEWIITGSVMGNVSLMAGINVRIVDYGRFSGVYFVDYTTHSIGSGYRTDFKMHRAYVEDGET